MKNPSLIATFCRLALAVAWVVSGSVKIKGERFAAGLSSNHPLGQYFDALLNTGLFKDWRHFVFPFQDTTLEVIAKFYEFEQPDYLMLRTQNG